MSADYAPLWTFPIPMTFPYSGDEDELVDLFEYQARDMFEAHGVPVLAGTVAETVEDARTAAEVIGAGSGGVVVVKAQDKESPG